MWQIVVQVTSDTGQVGYGWGGGGKASVPIVNGHFSELIVGMEVNSSDDIATIWDHLYFESIPYGRKGVALMALSGVDLALWDLLGKAENKTVAHLISPDVKSSIRCYGTGADPLMHAEMGLRGTKTPHRWTGEQSELDSLIAWAETARTALGDDGQLMIDTYMSWDLETTVAMAGHLADYQIHWFEDVLNPDELEGQAKLRNLVGDVNIAGGEHEFSHHGFNEIARVGAMDIWQPDITWCGGITAGLRILDIAANFDIPVVPHRGAEVWGLHLVAATACEDLAEYLTGGRNTETDEVWFGAPEPVDGQIDISESPGFGIAPNESLL
jgi:L-alanine-DL-glutamate epimerase-like enolase superfamily enzyme